MNDNEKIKYLEPLEPRTTQPPHEPADAILIYNGYAFQVVRIVRGGIAYIVNSMGGIVRE